MIKNILLISLIFLCTSACTIPVMYNDISQSPDGTVTIAGYQGDGRDMQAVLLICKRNNNELDCKSSRPGEIAARD